MVEFQLLREFKSENPLVKYKDKCPDDRALLIVHEDRCSVLDHIGPALDYIDDQGMFSDYFDPVCEGIASGVYIWEGKMAGGYDYRTHETDEYLEGKFRLATKEEWHAHLDNEYPWDRSLWIESEP